MHRRRAPGLGRNDEHAVGRSRELETAEKMNAESGAAPAAGGRDERVRTHELMGRRLREVRSRAGLGVRELARQLDLSASLISQIELGRVVPSVSTLYTLTNALGISMDSLFVEEPWGGAGDRVTAGAPFPFTAPRLNDTAAAPRPAESPLECTFIQRGESRRSIDLEQGVRWELLTPTPEPGAEFLEVHYPVGGSSSPNDHAIRHNGRDYCLILAGALSVQIGFDEYVLQEGDSLAFDATTPHRFWNAGTEPVRAVWFVLDRFATGS